MEAHERHVVGGFQSSHPKHDNSDDNEGESSEVLVGMNVFLPSDNLESGCRRDSLLFSHLASSSSNFPNSHQITIDSITSKII